MNTLQVEIEGKNMRRFTFRWLLVCLLLTAVALAGCAGKQSVTAEEKSIIPIREVPAPSRIAYAKMEMSRQKSLQVSLPIGQPASPADFNTEGYDRVNENGFLDVLKNPLSTFSIDVDTASYTNVRRFINNGTLPPPDAVRIEELINYFTYDYAQPSDGAPFSFSTELAGADRFASAPGEIVALIEELL